MLGDSHVDSHFRATVQFLTCGIRSAGLRRQEVGSHLADHATHSQQRWISGETIVLQEIWRGRLWAARPLIVVDDSNDRLVLWCPHGTKRKIPATPPGRRRPATRLDHVRESLIRGDWVLEDHEWDVSTLWLLEPGAWHAVWVSFLPDGRHLGWYVNLQEPYRRTPRGIQAMDMMLDIVVAPDRSWRWKDEDEFEAVVDAGLYADATVLAIREEAASVIRLIENWLVPFDEPWPEWRPPTGWSIPLLPKGWDQLD